MTYTFSDDDCSGVPQSVSIVSNEVSCDGAIATEYECNALEVSEPGLSLLIPRNGGIEMEEPIGKVSEPGKNWFIPQDDGIENDDYFIDIELSASNMLMFAAMICIVVTVITVAISCQRSGNKHVVYRKVVVHSDSDLEAERLK